MNNDDDSIMITFSKCKECREYSRCRCCTCQGFLRLCSSASVDCRIIKDDIDYSRVCKFFKEMKCD